MNNRYNRNQRCFRCGKGGHRAEKCYVTSRCYSCNEQGHFMRDCPKIQQQQGQPKKRDFPKRIATTAQQQPTQRNVCAGVAQEWRELRYKTECTQTDPMYVSNIGVAFADCNKGQEQWYSYNEGTGAKPHCNCTIGQEHSPQSLNQLVLLTKNLKFEPISVEKVSYNQEHQMWKIEVKNPPDLVINKKVVH